MKTEKVYSQIENKGKDIQTAPFWAKSYHEDEVTDEMFANGKQWYCYHVKFDDNIPIFLTKTQKIRNKK